MCITKLLSHKAVPNSQDWISSISQASRGSMVVLQCNDVLQIRIMEVETRFNSFFKPQLLTKEQTYVINLCDIFLR